MYQRKPQSEMKEKLLRKEREQYQRTRSQMKMMERIKKLLQGRTC